MAEVIQILKEELKIAMMLSGEGNCNEDNILTELDKLPPAGCKNLSDVERSILLHKPQLVRSHL